MTSKKIKLALVSGKYYAGGAEMFTRRLIHILDPARFRICIILTKEKKAITAPARCSVYYVNQLHWYHIFRTICRLRTLLYTLAPTCILSTSADTNRYTGFALCAFKQKPLWIARICANPFKGGRNLVARIITHWIDRMMLRFADRYIVNSSGLQQAVYTCYPYSKNTTTLLRNPIDIDDIIKKSHQEPALYYTDSVPLIISVGRLHRSKRYDILLQAIEYVYSRRPVTLWICGEGYMHDMLKKQIHSNAQHEYVKMLGFCRNPYALMRQADVFVLTSDNEGMPNALVEAMILGLGVVATDCPFGPGEIITHGINGYLASVRNPPDIARCILAALHNKNHHTMRMHASYHAKKMYNPETVQKQWNNFFLTQVSIHNSDR